MSGAPSELTLFLFGRAQHGPLEFSGPNDHVRSSAEGPQRLTDRSVDHDVHVVHVVRGG